MFIVRMMRNLVTALFYIAIALLIFLIVAYIAIVVGSHLLLWFFSMEPVQDFIETHIMIMMICLVIGIGALFSFIFGD